MATKPNEVIYFGYNRGEQMPLTIRMVNHCEIEIFACCMERVGDRILFHSLDCKHHSNTIVMAVVDANEFVSVCITRKQLEEYFGRRRSPVIEPVKENC